jgi:hypothetical protein
MAPINLGFPAMKKYLLACLSSIGLTLGLALLPVSASASAFDYHNQSNSAYAINVYSGTSCSGTHSVLYPGHTKSNVRSYRVNAYSKFKIGSGSWSKVYPPNGCLTIATSYTVYVFVYSNA